MTEVPEHLLKRSRDRRAALGLGGGGDAGGGGEARPPSPPPPRAPRSRPPRRAPPRPARPRSSRSRRARRPSRCPPTCGRRSSASASRSGSCPCWPSCPSGPSSTSTPCRSRTPTCRPSSPTGATVFANCSSCHGSQRRGRRRSSAQQRRGAQDLPATSPTSSSSCGRATWAPASATCTATRTGRAARTSPVSFGGQLMPAWNGVLTQSELLDVVRHERETLERRGRAAEADRRRRHACCGPTAHPVLNPTTGLLQNPDGSVDARPDHRQAHRAQGRRGGQGQGLSRPVRSARP